MKAETKFKPEKICVTTQFLKSRDGQLFLKWWKNHRHSGYTTEGINTFYSISPRLACNIDHYMAEFYSDHQIDEKLRYRYSADEYDKWAKEQEEFNKSNAETN